jgi:subtilisin family serine protease
MSGTSMATPHVAGAAALLCAAYPTESASQIKARILNGARDIGPVLNPGYWTYGVLDVLGAYQHVSVTDGYIEVNGENYGNGDTIFLYAYPDFFGYPNDLEFIPIPSNATITSIEWKSSNIYDIFSSPDQVVTIYEMQGHGGVEYLTVTVNETVTVELKTDTLIKK